MGAAESSQIIDIANSVYSEYITNILNQNTNNSTFNFGASQQINLIIGPEGRMECDGGGATGLINQSITGDITVVNEITQDTTTQIATLLDSQSETGIQQYQELMTELGGLLGTYMNTENQTEITNAIHNIVQQNITQTTLNEIVQRFQIDQSANVTILGVVSGECSINQNMMINIYSTAIIRNIVNNVIENVTETETTTDVEQSQTITVKGLSDLVSSIGDAVSGLLTAAIIPLVIVGIIVLAIGLGGAGIGGTFGKIMIGLMVFIVVGFGIYMAVAASQKLWPFGDNPPDDVQKEGCVEEWQAIQKLLDRLEKKEISLYEDDALLEYLSLPENTQDIPIMRKYILCMKLNQKNPDTYQTLLDNLDELQKAVSASAPAASFINKQAMRGMLW